MTQEQWLVYLYGVYPGDGITFLVIMWFMFTVVASVFIGFIPKKDWDREVYSRVNKFAKTVWIAGALLFIGNFIPDKKTFVAIVATPAIVDSYKQEDGKIYKMDLIIDKILDKTVRELTDTITEKGK